MNRRIQQDAKKKALWLSTNNIPSSLRGHKPITEYDLDLLTHVMGNSFLRLTNEVGGQIYADKQYKNTYVKKTKIYSKTGNNYIRNDYIILVENRVVLITIFIKSMDVFLPFHPDKCIQVDFMFSTDFYKNANRDVAYGKIHKIRYISKDKINVSGLTFLRFLKKVIQSTPLDTKVKIYYYDTQRGQIYKKALKGQKT